MSDQKAPAHHLANGVLALLVMVLAVFATGCTTDTLTSDTDTIPIISTGSDSPVPEPVPVPDRTRVTSPTRTNTPGTGNMTITAFDVGQGTSVLVTTPGGKSLLVDASDADHGPRLSDDIRLTGTYTLDGAVATHSHADHIGGYQKILAQIPIMRFYDSGYPGTSATYEKMLTTIKGKVRSGDMTFTAPTAGSAIDLGDANVTIAVLTPDGKNRGDIHDNMLTIRVTYRDVSCLFAGDMEDDLEQTVVASGAPIESEILIVGHHGSSTSSSTPFLTVVDPEVAIISVGADNSYGHPDAGTLKRLVATGATIYRTDEDGTITVTTDGSSYTVRTED